MPIVIAVVIALLGAAILYFAPDFSSAFGGTVGKPFWRARIFVNDKFAYIGSFTRTRNFLIEENKRLKGEIDENKARLMSLDSLSSEYKKLLESFGRDEIESRILAVVLAKPPQSPYDTIVLDIGEKHGISIGDRIFGLGDAALGEIISVHDSVSNARLFSSAETETHAIIERTDQTIIMNGTGGGGFESKVPQDTDIQINDVVVLPKSKVSVVGIVVNIESAVTSSFKRVIIQSPLNLNYIRWVEVETNENNL